MMNYLTRPKQGTLVRVRKPNAVPPKTKTIRKFSKGGVAAKPNPKVLFNQGSGKFEGLTPEDDMLMLDNIQYDAVLGKFVDTKTGKTGSLSDFANTKFDETLFENILDDNKMDKITTALKDKVKKGRAKQVKDFEKKQKRIARKADEEKPKPKPENVIPFVNPNEKPWYESDVIRDPLLDLSVEEYVALKEREYQQNQMAQIDNATKRGIGTLFRKKIFRQQK